MNRPIQTLLIGLMLIMDPCLLFAQSKKKQAKILSPQQIASLSSASTVLISTQDANGIALGMGTGFFVNKDTIVTNFHVIEGSAKIKIMAIDSGLDLVVSGVLNYSQEKDIAFIRTASHGTPLSIAGFPVVGDSIYVYGNPKGLVGTFSSGLVSALREEDGRPIMQISAPISPGSSGSPVLNKNGAACGIASAGVIGGQNLNFARPIDNELLLESRTATPLRSIPSSYKSGSSIRTDLIYIDRISFVRKYDTGPVPGECIEMTFSFNNDSEQDISITEFVLIFYDSRNRVLDYKTWSEKYNHQKYWSALNMRLSPIELKSRLSRKFTEKYYPASVMYKYLEENGLNSAKVRIIKYNVLD